MVSEEDLNKMGRSVSKLIDHGSTQIKKDEAFYISTQLYNIAKSDEVEVKRVDKEIEKFSQLLTEPLHKDIINQLGIKDMVSLYNSVLSRFINSWQLNLLLLGYFRKNYNNLTKEEFKECPNIGICKNAKISVTCKNHDFISDNNCKNFNEFQKRWVVSFGKKQVVEYDDKTVKDEFDLRYGKAKKKASSLYSILSVLLRKYPSKKELIYGLVESKKGEVVRDVGGDIRKSNENDNESDKPVS